MPRLAIEAASASGFARVKGGKAANDSFTAKINLFACRKNLGFISALWNGRSSSRSSGVHLRFIYMNGETEKAREPARAFPFSM
ncbi:MAG: hypothetical protein V4601_02225 [Pseudomonadota bacterium]